MTYDLNHIPDCYELTENEIVDFIVNLQDQIDCLLHNWNLAKDIEYKLQVANEIAYMANLQKELKNWLMSEKVKIVHQRPEPEEIYLNYC